MALMAATASTVFLGMTLLGIKPSTAAQPKPESLAVTTGSVLDVEIIPRTPERLARGKYLVDGLLQCPLCHSENDLSKRPLQPMPGKRLGGFVFPNTEIDLPKPNRVVAPNISSDPKYGAGTWKDADFVRALRQGIGHDGRTLYPMMPYSYFRTLSDEDLASVIVYERSAAPVHIKRPTIRLTDEIRKTFQSMQPLPPVPEPDRLDRIKYGKYLVDIGHCDSCHTTTDEKGDPVPGMYLAGGPPLTGPWEGGKKIVTVNALNLTPDPSGIGYFDETMFIEVIRNGGFKARPLSNIMPWAFFRNLTDDDLKAIFAYLRTLPPVRHNVDNTQEATYCKQCRTKHGLGAMN
jgi:mono/diheme cytochrome c family protein